MYINRLKQEFDDRITMFRLENIYILKENCRMFTKTSLRGRRKKGRERGREKARKRGKRRERLL